MSLVAPGSDSSTPPRSPGTRRHSSMIAGSGTVTDLAVWTDQSSNRCVLNLRGRLCRDTVSLLDRHVDRLGCRWCDEVVVDLRSLELIDEVGARLLVGLGHYVGGRGGTFRIQGARADIGVVIDAAEVDLET